MTGPSTPTAFTTPQVNPAVGGQGVPLAYVSNSQYTFAPTSMNTGDLVPGGSGEQQAQSLADVLDRASAWADRYCFGADPAAKGASLAATVSVESDRVWPLAGMLRLVCDYKPIIAVTGVDVGSEPSSLSSIGAANAANIRFGRRTIYVPATAVPNATQTWPPLPRFPYIVAWSYVNGYPHMQLASAVSSGATSITVAPTDGGAGVLGVYPGTQLRIIDGAATETVTVTAVNGTTLTATVANAHTLPEAPDFTPVTAIPADVTQAVIFLTSALIKTRGDNSLVLDEITEPNAVKPQAGDEFTDVSIAKELLHPYRVRVKAPR